MTKFKILLAQFALLLTIILPSHASDDSSERGGKGSTYHRSFFGFGNFDDGFDYPDLDYSPPKPKFSSHAFVPDSSGKLQGRSAFKLLFSGQEDPTTVRIITRVPIEQYTFREKMKYLVSGKEISDSFLTGTMTDEGVLTNGHGFVEKVPSVRNKLLELAGSKKFHYRILQPVAMEQGLTWEYFVSENEDYYHDPKYSSALRPSIHAVYTQEQIEVVSTMKGYIAKESPSSKKDWFYGSINPLCDVALLKIKAVHRPSHTCPVSDDLPSQSERVKVRIFQYPEGHPLQKVSEEYADFSRRTHQCVTLPGSSGSSLKESEGGKIVGIHQGGREGMYNRFIPFNKSMIGDINIAVYSSEKH